MHTQITSAIVEDTPAPKSGSLLIRDTKLIGFGLRISPLGTRTFIVEGKLRGTRTTRRLSLGRYPIVTLGRARDKARETLYQLYLGIDPRLEARRQQEADIQTGAWGYPLRCRLESVRITPNVPNEGPLYCSRKNSEVTVYERRRSDS